MDRQKFVLLCKRTHLLQGVEIVFSESGAESLRRLADYTRIDGGYDATISVLVGESLGKNITQRTFQFYGIRNVNGDVLESVAGDIQSIRPVTEHLVSGLMSSRQKKQKLEAEKIISAVLTTDLVAGFEKWGLDIEAYLSKHQGIPNVTFKISYEGCPVRELILDGWKGQFLCYHKPAVSCPSALDDRLIIEICQVREILLSEMDQIVEQLANE